MGFTLKTGALLMLGGLTLLTGCQKDEINPQNSATNSPGYNASALLDNVANNVILATYQDLDQKALALQTAVATLSSAPSAATLEAARQAYRDARAPWEATEAFAFGPVSTQGLDGIIDTWPLNINDLSRLLAGAGPLTPATLRQLDGGLQGFHPIEYLLFGADASKPLAAFTAREYTFLTSASQNLKVATGQLLQAWLPTGGNFAGAFGKSGPGSSLYPKQSLALQELLAGLQGAADELPNSKIELPLARKNTDFEEAKFSRNSKAEFLQNLAGIENVYSGRYGQQGSGIGIGDLVKRRNPTLDSRFRQELAAAKKAVEDLPGRFDEAIFQSPAAVLAAQGKIRVVLNTLQVDMQPLVEAI